MKIINLQKICVIFSILLTTTYLQAESNFSIGKKLSKEELSKLNGSNINLDDQSFKIISEQTANKTVTTKSAQAQTSKTYLVNQHGIIGVSDNTVVISEIFPYQVRSDAIHIIHAALSTKYYDNINTTTLQFSNFNQALNARNELTKLLPKAKITIPILFNQTKIR